MIGVILAAGIASRLRPLTASMPKCLLPVGGIPLLQRSLTSLQQTGVRDVVLVTGFRHEQIEAFVHSLSADLNISFIHNDRFESTNNNYSLWLTKPVVLGSDMVMMDSDILFDRRILEAVLGASHQDVLALRKSRDLGNEEIKVECDRQGYVRRIGKEVNARNAAGESLGIERFSGPTTHLLFASLDRRKHLNEFYEASFQEAIDAGAKILPVETTDLPCIEIDTPDDLRAADAIARRIRL
jgi:choline kinase